MIFNRSFLRNLFGRRKPVIHLYSICWNEEYMLPYFFRHYDGIVDRYVFFDDGSTDRTLEILEKHAKVELRSLPRPDVDSYVLAAKEIQDQCWKESRGKADWVIITAVDEHLYHKDLPGYITQCRKEGVTLIPGTGYQMLSPVLPRANRKLTKIVTRGTPYHWMNKLSLFDPDKIAETDFSLGRHAAQPVGEVVYPPRDELLILHYKYLSMDWTYNRHVELEEKLGRKDKENKWGTHYSWTKEELKKEWDLLEADAVDNVMRPGIHEKIIAAKAEKPWWRQ